MFKLIKVKQGTGAHGKENRPITRHAQKNRRTETKKNMSTWCSLSWKRELA